MNVYFDNAATTKIRDEVIDNMSFVLKDCFGNPSSTHSYGRSAKSYIETSRKSIAKILNCDPGEIIFNSGGTESDNSILKCVVKDLDVKHIISSKIEHHAITHTLDELKIQGVNVNYVKLSENGNVDIDNLEYLLSYNDEPKLVTLMYINNEIGNILDVKYVSDLCQKYNSFFHTDAVQAVGHYKIDLKSINIDFLSSAAHKFHGPKGAGFLYLNNKHKISPFIHGGAQERNMRGGTENVYGIVGLAEALELSITNMADHAKKVSNLKKYMIEKLTHAVDGIKFNGQSSDLNNSLYTVLNVSIPNMNDQQMFLFNLDINNIAASAGSACTSGSEVGSHVLAQVKKNKGHVSVRFSFSKMNSKEEVDYTVDKVCEILKI